jgi:site-specific recombinase XerD
MSAPVDITAKVMREYVYHLKDLGLSPASIRRNVSAIRTYFRFLTGDGIVVRDPSERLETPKQWRSLPEVSDASRRCRSCSRARRSTTTRLPRSRATRVGVRRLAARVEWITLGAAAT